MIRELAAGETHLAWTAMSALRPHLGSLETMVERIDGLQRAEGYRLVGDFACDDSEALGVAGFRVNNKLAWGRHLYVDDLVTAPAARGAGSAGRLLEWLVDEALRLGCGQFHLDSGVHPDRNDAHRLYLNHRLTVTSLHFVRTLT